MYSSLNYSVYGYVCPTLVVFVCTTLVVFMCTTLILFVCSTSVVFMCSTLVVFVCTTLVLFTTHKWSHLGVARQLGVTEKRHIQNFSGSFNK